MQMKKKLIICVILIVLLGLWWRVDFYDQKTKYEETEVSGSDTSFEASFDSISSIVLSNGDVSIADRMDKENCNVTVTFLDSNGNVAATCHSDEMNIHTNGYTSRDNCNFSGLPVQLNNGEKYTVSYECTMPDGTKANDISFILYGESKSCNRDTAFLFMLAIIAIVISVLSIGEDKANIFRYMAVWFILVLITIFIMPVISSERERSSFADVYEMSNELIGKNGADESGYVYIDESGIRNNGYVSYSIPVLRFWTDASYGNVRDDNKVSINYRCSEDGKNILMYPSVIAVTAARSLRLSFRSVFCTGWLINAFVTGVLLLSSLMIVKKSDAVTVMIKVIFLMPAVVISSMSYTGFGIALALCVLLYTLFIRIDDDVKNVNRIVLSCVVALVLVIYAVQHLMHISLSGGSFGAFICAGLNTLFTRFDVMLNELVLHDSLDNSKIFISTYIFIFMIVYLKSKADKEAASLRNGRMILKFRYCIPVIIAYCLIVMLTRKYTSGSGAYGLFTDISGCVFIPLMFIPYNAKCSYLNQTENDNRNDGIMIAIAAVTSCIVELIRYAAL